MVAVKYECIDTSEWVGGFRVGCGCETTEDRVKRLERERAEKDKQLADAKAKLAAEQAEKNKTYGQRVAEKQIRSIVGPDGHEAYVNVYNANMVGRSVRSTGGTEAGTELRAIFATALDKAYADGRAEQRESDAKIADDEGKAFADKFDNYSYGARNASLFIGSSIRGNK